MATTWPNCSGTSPPGRAQRRREGRGLDGERSRTPLLDAPRERLTGRRVVRVAEGLAIAQGRPLAPDLLAAAAPLLLTAVLLLAAPGFLEPLFEDKVSLLGAPMGITLTVGFALLAGLGVLALRRGGVREGRTRLLAAAMLAVPLPPLLLLYGIETALGYALVAAVFLGVTSVRWLSFAIAVPFVLWLLFGPAVMLVVINSILSRDQLSHACQLGLCVPAQALLLDPALRDPAMSANGRKRVTTRYSGRPFSTVPRRPTKRRTP